MEAEAKADCSPISASQVDLLARANFIGGGGGGAVEEEEAEVFSTPPLTEQDSQRQGQSQRGQAGDGEDSIAMRSVPFTQIQPTPSPSFSPPSDTPTPTPTPTPSPSPELDPLVRMVLMVPTAPLPTTGHKNILDLARSRGIFADVEPQPRPHGPHRSSS